MGQALVTTASANILYRNMKNEKASYTARQANNFGMIYDREERVSVLRDASEVIASMKKKSAVARIRDSFLEDAAPKKRRKKKELSVHDIGNRFITIATAASIMMGGLFITEHVVGIIDSAHASTALGKHIR